MSGAEALIIGGTGLNMLGNYQANLAQAGAEERNARYLIDEADFIRDTAKREEMLLRSDREQVKGAQAAAYGASGFSLAGSALQVIADTDYKTQIEANAIRREGRLKEYLARARAADAMSTARTLRSDDYNIKQALGTILNTGGQYAARKE
jgi:hypothetical protein